MLNELFEMNGGKGYRGVGRWLIIEDASLLSNYGFDTLELRHANAILSKYNKVIIMQDGYGDKYYSHSECSFALLFMSNIVGDLAYGDLNNVDIEYFKLCYQILDKNKIFI